MRNKPITRRKRNIPITRWEKIKLLNDIKAGKVSVFDLKDIRYSAWIQDSRNMEYYYCDEFKIRCKLSEITKYSKSKGCNGEIVVTFKEGFTIL